VIRDGARNDTLFRHGSSLRAQGLDQEQIRAALERINVTRCASPLDAAELDAIAKSAARYDPGNEHLTDLGNARRLVQQHGNQLRYVQECGSWYTWDGRVWALDRTGEVMRYAKATVRQMYIEATAIEDSGQRERLVRWALASESEHHLQAMIALASTEPGIATAVESLDRDPWLLNVLNGTIELRSGTLRKHNPEDLTTRLVSVEFDPTATAPMWEAFLSTVMGADAELISYVQRLAGYSLTGDVSEQVLLFLHGYGSNGKTTLLNTLLELLGPYAKQADPQLLMARSNDTHPTNMADLRGSRLVVCCEVDEGRPLAEATVKQLTGSDRIKARFMRQDFFEFDPTHKIWLAANHKPVVRGTDHAMWRRIRLIPFMVTISEAQQDRQLSAKLRTELPGILAWAVQGCLAWLRDGLAAPDGVLMATAEYRSEMDLVAQFVDERCHEDQAAEVYAKALYAAYRDWCEEAGLEHPCVKQAFGRRMAERGYGKRKAAGGQLVYQGVELQ
jgi:putative DNA primase/helicase